MKRAYSTRQFSGQSGGRFTGAPVTKWLLIAILAFFLVDVSGASSVGRLKPYFMLFGAGSVAEFWRLATYMLVDFNVIAWIFSLMIIYSFGRVVERSIGSRRFKVFLVYSVLAGSLTYVLMSLVSGGQTPLTGASSITISLVVAAAMLFPEQQVQMMLPPMPVKLKNLALFFVGFIVIMSIAQRVDPAVSLSQLSGVAVGYFCMKRMSFLDVGKKNLKVQKQSKVKVAKVVKKKKVGMRARTVLKMSESKREAEVNQILEKVSAEGIGNLTDSEKEILNFAAKNDR